MVLLDTVTGKYSKCQLFFSLNFECVIAHSTPSIILNQSLSSVDHSSIKSRKGYDLLKAFFFFFFPLALVTPANFMEIQLLLQSLYTISGRSLWMSQVTSALM